MIGWLFGGIVVAALIAAVLYNEFTKKHRPNPEIEFIPLPPMPHDDPELVEAPVSPKTDSKQELLYHTAVECLGRDLAPNSAIPDDVKCVVQVQEVLKLAYGSYLGAGDALYNTKALWQTLASSPDWEEIPEPEYGCVMVAPTGTGDLPHGHAAITLKHGLGSNDSGSGRFTQNYTYEAFTRFFKTLHGFAIHTYRPKG